VSWFQKFLTSSFLGYPKNPRLLRISPRFVAAVGIATPNPAVSEGVVKTIDDEETSG
jgi:hypothetical protein